MAALALAALSENTSRSVPLFFFFLCAKVSLAPLGELGKTEAQELAYYTICGFRERFDSRQNVSACRNVSGNIFLQTLFIQNFGFYGAVLA